jgi:hypothetical protein
LEEGVVESIGRLPRLCFVTLGSYDADTEAKNEAENEK